MTGVQTCALPISVYHILTENIPKLKSHNRKDVLVSLRSLPKNLDEHLIQFGLYGVMQCGLLNNNETRGNAIIKLFDQEYQKITGNKSIFDRRQKDFYVLP